MYKCTQTLNLNKGQTDNDFNVMQENKKTTQKINNSLQKT